MKNFYVYKFTDKCKKVLYIGQTNNLSKRIDQEHFAKRGDDKAYKTEWASNIFQIEYCICASLEDMKIKERYFINTLQPKFNKQLNKNHPFSFVINTEWLTFERKKERIHVPIDEKNELQVINTKQVRRRKLVQKEGFKLYTINIPEDVYVTVNNLIRLKLREQFCYYTIKSTFLEGLEQLKAKNPGISESQSNERRYYRGGSQKKKIKTINTAVIMLTKDIYWIDNYINEQKKENIYFSKTDFISVLILELKIKYAFNKQII